MSGRSSGPSNIAAWEQHLDREVVSDGMEATVEDGEEMTEADLEKFDPAANAARRQR